MSWSSEPLRIALPVWIYRTLVKLFPGELHIEFAPEMTQTFADACRVASDRAGFRGVLRVSLLGFVDLVNRLPREWRDHLTPVRRRPRGEKREAQIMETLLQDLRYSVRSLAKSPGFSIVVALTLALGVGANTAIFSVVQGVLLAPPPYPEPERVVTLAEMNPDIDIEPRWVSIPNYIDWKEQNESLEHVALFRGRSRAVTGGDEPQYVYTASVTDEFFDAFGITPILGRTFAPEETVGVPGQPWWNMPTSAVVVLSHAMWERQFGGDSSIVGAAIAIDGVANTIIGIMPPGFTQPGPWIRPDINIDLWLPFPLEASSTQRVNRSFNAVGRLRSGTTAVQARADLDVIAARLRDAYPAPNQDWEVSLIPWHDMIVGDVRSALILVWAVSGIVLLIACANVANLKLNRMLSRKGEMVVRAALGAGRSRLMRQVLTESTVLALFGGALGLAVAFGGIELVRALNPGNIPMVHQIGINPVVLGVALATTLITAVIFGVVPAVLASRPNLATDIRESSARSASKNRHRIRGVMAATQLVLAFTLLIGASLIAKSFVRLTSVSPGLNPEGVFQATVALPWDRVSTLTERADFVGRMLDRIEALPGVTSAAMINSLPFTGSNQFAPIWIDGQPEPEPDRAELAAFRGISPRYFETMEIPIIEGRPFNSGDLENPTTAIVNRMFAERYWPGESPIGRLVNLPGSTVQLTVVGVVENVKHYGLDNDAKGELYRPYTRDFLTSKAFVLRTTNDPATYGPLVKRAILAVDPDQPIRDMSTMEWIIGRSIASPKFNTAMLTVAAAVAVILAAIGLFGVVSFAVTERTHEIGVRMALGANQSGVVGAVLRRGVMLAGAGVLGGLALSLSSARVLESFLFGVAPHDALTYVVVSGGFVAVTLLASYLPARRASRVDPMVALRGE